MKTIDCLESYKWRLRNLKECVHRIMIQRTIVQNISRLLPEWEFKQWYGMELGLTISKPELKAYDFYASVRQISKRLRQKPELRITKESFQADWKLWLDSNLCLLTLEIVNTEACEFIQVKKTITVSEPTGYCKEVLKRLEELTIQ